jgi:leucyl-tRNA synthetase
MSNLLKLQVYVGLMEIIKDKQYYYRSNVDANFNKFTDEGREEVVKYLSIMAPHMLREVEEELDMRAKQMVIQELER